MLFEQPRVSSNSLPTYSTHVVPSPAVGIHSIDFVKSNAWDDQGSRSIVFDEGYSDDGVHEVFPSQQILAHVVSTPSITLV